MVVSDSIENVIGALILGLEKNKLNLVKIVI